MVSEAEDEVISARVAAKDGLESYTYNLRNSINDLESAANEATVWLDSSQEASKEGYEERQKELEGIANPIMQKPHTGASGVPGAFPNPGGAPGRFPGSSGAGGEDGPSVEEVEAPPGNKVFGNQCSDERVDVRAYFWHTMKVSYATVVAEFAVPVWSVEGVLAELLQIK